MPLILEKYPLLRPSKLLTQQDVLTYRPVPKEGIYQCGHCGSYETAVTEKQTRSGMKH